MGIMVDVMSSRGADARTEYPNGLTLVASSECSMPAGPVRASEDRPGVVIVRKRYSFGEGLMAVLVESDGGVVKEVRRPGCVGPMFNGRFIWSSDARFGEATGQGAFAQPVKLMDRWETPAEYATYD